MLWMTYRTVPFLIFFVANSPLPLLRVGRTSRLLSKLRGGVLASTGRLRTASIAPAAHIGRVDRNGSEQNAPAAVNNRPPAPKPTRRIDRNSIDGCWVGEKLDVG